jgi:CRP-like cAMP-binding protein
VSSGDSVADALGRTARYGRCPRRERQAIAQLSTRVDVPAGAVLAQQGAPGQEFIIVLTGGATVRTDGRVASALLAGDHYGDVALLDDRRTPATVVAETPMALAVVGRDQFPELLERSPWVARSVLRTLASRMRAGRAA